MELTHSPVFYLFLLGGGMGLCLFLFISLKRKIFRLDRQDRKVEEFLSCVLSDQLYWAKQMPTNTRNGVSYAWLWLKGVWPAALAQGLEAMLGAKAGFDCLPTEAIVPAGSQEEFWWQTEFSGMGGAKLYCGCPAQVADQIGRAVLTAQGVSVVDSEGTYQAIAEKSLLAVAKGLSRERNEDVACINGCTCQRPADSFFVQQVFVLILVLWRCAGLLLLQRDLR